MLIGKMMGKLKQNLLLVTTLGRGTNKHSKNKSILWRNKGYQTLDMFTFIFPTNSQKSPHIASFIDHVLMQSLKVIFQTLLQTDLAVFPVATLNCLSLL